MDLLEYEYQKPQKPVIKPAIVPVQPVVKPVQEFRVSGVTFDKRQEALQRLTTYNPKDVHTYLVPEFDNEYDKNAIAVYVLVNNANTSYRLGYIPRTDTAIAKNYIGKIPALKILDGDILGARLVFNLDEAVGTVIEEPAIDKPVTAVVEPARKTVKRAPKVKKENGAFTGWTYNRLGTRQTKICNW
jgi:hypothetical protein